MLGRRILGVPRFVLALAVAGFATAAALHLFFASQTPAPYLSEIQGGRVDGLDYSLETEPEPEFAQPAAPSVTISTALERSAYIETYLMEAGVEHDEALQWAEIFEGAARTRVLHRGHPLTLYKDPDNGDMRGLKYDLDDQNSIVVVSLGSGIIKAAVRPILYVDKPIKLTFEITDSFQNSAEEHGIPRPIIDSLRDAFADRRDLDRLRPGSAVKLIYSQKVSPDGTEMSAPEVEAAQIRSGSRTMEAYAFSDEQGRPHLYDEQGRALGPQSLQFPLNFKYISSPFSFHRFHPILGEYRPHVGVDLVAEYGTPVKAVADGTVQHAGWLGELGNCVKIEHPHGLISIYGHLSRISRDIRPGTTVQVGQVIGNVGSTGLSTGPHLHFAIEKQGAYVNPLTQKLGENHEVSPRMHSLFEDIKLRYESTLASLPDLGSHFIASDERKPAISPLGDMYHISIKPVSAVSSSHHKSHHRGGLIRTSVSTDSAGGL
jgi:murein DD-endopeptidase MepM/ murein hydrolase activator NlpD